MMTCKFLIDYAVFMTSHQSINSTGKVKMSSILAQTTTSECTGREKELLHILSKLEVEDGLSASFTHNPKLSIAFFVDDTTYKSKTGSTFSRALLYAFRLEKRMFGMDPKKHYQLPVSNTIEVGTLVFCY
jgi:hypothetical protein